MNSVASNGATASRGTSGSLALLPFIQWNGCECSDAKLPLPPVSARSPGVLSPLARRCGRTTRFSGKRPHRNLYIHRAYALEH